MVGSLTHAADGNRLGRFFSIHVEYWRILCVKLGLIMVLGVEFGWFRSLNEHLESVFNTGTFSFGREDFLCRIPPSWLPGAVRRLKNLARKDGPIRGPDDLRAEGLYSPR